MSIPGALFTWLSHKRPGARTPALGARELAVLDILWRANPLSAQQVLESMGDDALALSTVQSTLERLERKQIVAREKRSRAYFYTPQLARQDIIRSLLQDIGEEIAGGDLAPMVSGFMDYLDNEGNKLPQELTGRLKQAKPDADK